MGRPRPSRQKKGVLYESFSPLCGPCDPPDNKDGSGEGHGGLGVCVDDWFFHFLVGGFSMVGQKMQKKRIDFGGKAVCFLLLLRCYVQKSVSCNQWTVHGLSNEP